MIKLQHSCIAGSVPFSCGQAGTPDTTNGEIKLGHYSSHVYLETHGLFRYLPLDFITVALRMNLFFDNIRMAVRYARGLNGFFRHTLSPEECRAMVVHRLRNRSESFLRIVERGIFKNPQSPYKALMQWAGVEYGDVEKLVHQEGVEDALAQLYAAGVNVTLDEFKGKTAIRRSNFELQVHARDFDNPLTVKHYEGRTGGSTSPMGSRLLFDLDLLKHEAAYEHIALSALGFLGHTVSIWRSMPPGSAGIKMMLRRSKLGLKTERWFTQNEPTPFRGNLKFYLFTMYTVLVSRVLGKPIPKPEHVPLTSAVEVAEWIAQQRAQRLPVYFEAPAGAAVRICLAAQEHGLDIAGTFFRVGGEPLTAAKLKVIQNSGCVARCHYSMAEVGRIGGLCLNPEAIDDVHIWQDKLAVLQRAKQLPSGAAVSPFFFTTLHPATPKLMLNVDSGDYGILTERQCGCPLDELGFHQHIHTIRSYEKLVSDGMLFVGTDLLRLVEEILPSKFGGQPTNYQFVEEDSDGLTKVSLVVSPNVGAINENAVIAEALHVLGSSSDANRMMANYWRDGKTLRVVRREPYATSAAKIQPLHIVRQKEENGS